MEAALERRQRAEDEVGGKLTRGWRCGGEEFNGLGKGHREKVAINVLVTNHDESDLWNLKSPTTSEYAPTMSRQVVLPFSRGIHHLLSADALTILVEPQSGVCKSRRTIRFHPDRTACRDCHYCNSGGDVVTRTEQSQSEGAKYPVHEQFAPSHVGVAALRG